MLTPTILLIVVEVAPNHDGSQLRTCAMRSLHEFKDSPSEIFHLDAGLCMFLFRFVTVPVPCHLINAEMNEAESSNARQSLKPLFKFAIHNPVRWINLLVRHFNAKEVKVVANLTKLFELFLANSGNGGSRYEMRYEIRCEILCYPERAKSFTMLPETYHEAVKVVEICDDLQTRKRFT
ncbi:hypothetical protein SNOG_20074 [Parastagonospora nodorum SN15]|uniref:Uncharacterized protein n=1 Tax=Phaeosphaeria nodorum (strain SN15 / ATCC MYA-4574 / FGSC 10173) TaxID=321614 RepID=A9JX71_PHANO|nr:hypothetical protein SNOG_20074 [Parastagonospora nodorum SN15]EDP89763.1 hypothetical protein SNOG_20074 [Parastagonospora nodorum SN15]